MIYLTRQTVIAFAAGGLVVGGAIPVIQNLASLDLPAFAAPAGSPGASTAKLTGAKANGAIPAAASIAAEPGDLPRVPRARAGEPLASPDGSGTPMPISAHSRGRDL